LEVVDRSGSKYFFKAPPLCCDFETWVPSGKFRLAADFMSADGSFNASTPLEVRDSDIVDITVPLAPKTEISIPIEITFSPSRKPSCIERQILCGFFNLWLIRHMDNGYFEVGPQRATLLDKNPNGVYRSEPLSVRSGTYSIVVSASANLYAQSISRNSTDLTLEPLVVKPDDASNPIQVVLADGAVVEGKTIASDKPVRAWVYAIPQMPDAKLFQPLTSDTEGKFRIEGLAPAEYIVFATDVELGINLRDPKEVEFWQKHGKHLKLEVGTSTKAELQIIPVPRELYPREAPPKTAN
jgi:hypothetical protein